MFATSTLLSQGTGTSSVQSLPRSLLATPSPIGEIGATRDIWSRGATDDVWLSSRAALSFGTDPIDASSFDLSGDSGLVAAARSAHQYLADHPTVAESALGKSVTLLVRATLHLEKSGDFDTIPEESKELILRAVDTVESFLEEHTRVADSDFGTAIAEMAEAVSQSIKIDGGSAGTQMIDWLLEAAKRAEAYLEEYPAVASMPLGEVVAKLTDGVKALADGNPLDADLQTLAKRVGYFLENHPRLAQSEFGQLIAPLGRGVGAIDVSALPAAESPARETFATAAPAAVVLDMTAAAGIGQEVRAAA